MNIMLITNAQLSETQWQEVSQLMAACDEVDGGTPIVYSHLLKERREVESNVLYYDNHRLVAFLSLYFFYEEAVEVCLVVAPEYRRQGLADTLIRSIVPLLKPKEIRTLIFTCPTSLNDNWLMSKGFDYLHSEYHMQRIGFDPILFNAPELGFRLARTSDIPRLCEISEACFGGQSSEMPQRFYRLLNDCHYCLMVIEQQGIVIGKAHWRFDGSGAILSDVAIIPGCQGQGKGSALLVYAINHALTLGNTHLMLNVESANQNALDLYIRQGFSVVKVHDYWSTPVSRLVERIFAKDK
jgi:ribosomal protein S18 acetylase RimI-like enzyme